MAIFAIPSTQELYIMHLYAGINRGGGDLNCDCSLVVNPDPQVTLTNYVTRHTWSVRKTGTSHTDIPFSVPKVIPGPAIIKVRATSDVNDADIDAGFDGVIAPSQGGNG